MMRTGPGPTAAPPSDAGTMVELFLVSMVVLLGGFGFYRLMRAQQEARLYLESGAEAPLQLSHLSSELARIARETRTLRISLEESAAGDPRVHAHGPDAHRG